MGSITGHILRLSKVTLKFSVLTIVALSVILAVGTTYDSVVGDGEIGQFCLLVIERNPRQQHSLVFDHSGDEQTTTPENMWDNLRYSVLILYRIHPQAGRWVMQQHIDGKLVLGNARNNFCAYDYPSGVLTVNKFFYNNCDGKRAVLLAHEYRHYRQNHGKLLRYVVSHMFRSGGQESIIENDAILFENEASVSIFRTPYRYQNHDQR